MRLAGRPWHPLPAALALSLSLALAGTAGSAAGIGAEAAGDASSRARALSGMGEGEAAGIVRTLAHAVVSCPPGWEGQLPAESGETPPHRPSAKNEAENTRVSTMTSGSCDPADLADF